MLGLVDFVECPFDRVRGDDVLEPDVNNAKACFVFVQDLLELFLCDFVEFLPVLENVIKTPVSNDPPDHRLADVSDRLDRVPDVKEVLLRVLSSELNDPFNIDDVEITRQHERFPLHHRGFFTSRANARPNRSKAERLGIHLFGVDLVHGVDTKGDLEVKSRHDRPRIPSESEHDPSVTRWDGIDRRGYHDDEKNDDNHNKPEIPATTLFEAHGILRLLDHFA